MELPKSNIYINFYRHHFCCFTIVSLFVLDKSMAWNNALASKNYVKLFKPPKI
jgi:hypothetical protein